jgi:hypothetical protein
MKSCCKINNKVSKKTIKCKRKDGKIYSLPRRYSKNKCTTRKIKGFSVRSSCAPYKYCKKTNRISTRRIKKQSKKTRKTKKDVKKYTKKQKGGTENNGCTHEQRNSCECKISFVKKNDLDKEEQCVICLNKLVDSADFNDNSLTYEEKLRGSVVYQIGCGHQFHGYCLYDYSNTENIVNGKGPCPICRRSCVTEDDTFAVDAFSARGPMGLHEGNQYESPEYTGENMETYTQRQPQPETNTRTYQDYMNTNLNGLKNFILRKKKGGRDKQRNGKRKPRETTEDKDTSEYSNSNSASVEQASSIKQLPHNSNYPPPPPPRSKNP